MRAAVYHSDTGLVVEDVALPEIGKDGVLVKISNTGFCGTDHSMLESGGIPDGIILGHEVSGTIDDMGSGVTGVEKGMRVIIRPTFCGKCRDCLMGKPYLCQENRRSIGIGDLPGGFAEYIRVLPQMLIPVPEGVDSRNAALAEAFAASYHAFVRSGRRDGSALVLGGGVIGLALVRILKLMGFGPVALSEPMAAKRELAKGYGADIVVDPFNEDMNAFVFQQTNGVGFESVYECSGVPDNVQEAMNFCARGGMVCVVSILMKPVAITPVTLNFKEINLTACYSNTHEENIQCLEWMAQGQIDGRPMISDLVDLEDLPGIYNERIRTGRAVKVVLKIGEEF